MFVLEFDIAAIFLDLVIIWFFRHKKTLPTKQNRIFFVLLICSFISAFFDLLTTLFSVYSVPVPRFVLWFANCIYYTGMNFLPVICAFYALAIADCAKKMSENGKRTVQLYIPALISFCAIWLSPFVYRFFPLAFYIDESNVYHRGNSIFFYILYIISAYYLVVSIITLFVHRKRIEIEKVWLYFFYISVSIVSVIVQLIFPGLLVECFGISIADLAFFVYLQKPEEVIDCSTDLFNQTAFVKMAETQCNSGNHTCISIIIDDIPFLTNTFGIKQMNQFYCQIADFLREEIKGVMIYSFGGGIFTIVASGSNNNEIEKIINSIKARFKKYWIQEAVKIKLYSRICVIFCPEDVQTPEEAIDIINFVHSDERYRQGVVFAREMDLENKKRRAYLERLLRTGLSESRYDVYYQPLYSTAKKRLIGAEALIRLTDDNGEFISPEDFIPISEKNGTILRIGEFVFETVCKTLSSVSVEEYGIEKVDINLSVAQCMQEILSDQLLTIKSMYKVPSSIINLEITETASAHTPATLLENMNRLSEAGIELSLDDYGSGYSNMSYLLGLPFKMIKIDKYIVWAAFKDKRAETALKATVKMIKALDMTVLAEGVETKEMADWLTKLGCDYLQGFYFSKPVPKEEFLRIMKESTEKNCEIGAGGKRKSVKAEKAAGELKNGGQDIKKSGKSEASSLPDDGEIEELLEV